MITKIKNTLFSSEDKIHKILEKIGCYNIKLLGNRFRFGLDDEGSSNGNSIDVNTLHFKSFSKDESGDILTLVALKLNIGLGEAIKWCANELNISYEYTEKTDVVLPFCGFFKKYEKIKEDEDSPPLTYPNDRYSEYDTGISQLFINDGIAAITQEYFSIGFDHNSNRITIPWYNEVGEMVGIMGRLNQTDIKEKESKYLPIIPFNKSKVIYGFNINYRDILESGLIIICESEKSVHKAYQMGYKNVVAIGGNNISNRHCKLIKSMCVDAVVAFDEGMELKHCIEQAKKLKINNPFFNNSIYVVDTEELPEKHCIFDMELKIVQEHLQDKLIYID